MPLSHYLNENCVCVLQGQTPETAIKELVGLVCHHRKDLSQEQVFNAVLEREKDVGTQIGPQLALPHARIPNVGHPIMAVGLSSAGIAWGGSVDSSVHLVILLLGDEARPNTLLEALATLARTFSPEDALSAILSATTPRALYEALLNHAAGEGKIADPSLQAATETVYASACALAKETQAGCLLVMTEQLAGFEFLSSRPSPCSTLLAINPRRDLSAPDVPFDHVIEIPLHGLKPNDALDFSLLMAVSRGMLKRHGRVVCLYGSADASRLDTIRVLDVGKDLRIPLSLRDELESGEIDFQVLLRVFTLATELAREGREGKHLGTLFVLGDYEHVQEFCHQMVINPFKGYGDEEKNILDPSLAETVKEFAHIDGAFIVRGDGVIMAAGSFIRAAEMGDRLEGGLGARHTAGQAITASTKALSLVLSESTGTLTLYKNGSCVLTLKRGNG
ncbi:PTS sugar transporter subunit IIA [Pontiellaceae bacterium B12219]|nr:PTS sugar transporter subunit IIA [Pontiellaceae bacterium B12219]